MPRSLARALTVAAVSTAVLGTAAAANATTIATFKNPTTGCTYSVYGPDATIHTLPSPGVTTTGGFGESVACP